MNISSKPHFQCIESIWFSLQSMFKQKFHNRKLENKFEQNSTSTSTEYCTYSWEGKLWPTETAYSKAETLLYHQSPSSQGYGFSSGHVWMWELDYKESWALKNWRFWTVVLKKTLGSPLYCKEIQPVHPKGDQSWVFIGGTHVEAEAPILWPPDAESWLIWKDSDAGEDWRQEEKGMTEDEMVGWHHWLDGH